jgi:hypothetical protein
MAFRLAACTRAIAVVAVVTTFGAIDACGSGTVADVSGPGADDAGLGQQSDSGAPQEGGGQDGAVPEGD